MQCVIALRSAIKFTNAVFTQFHAVFKSKVRCEKIVICFKWYNNDVPDVQRAHYFSKKLARAQFSIGTCESTPAYFVYFKLYVYFEKSLRKMMRAQYLESHGKPFVLCGDSLLPVSSDQNNLRKLERSHLYCPFKLPGKAAVDVKMVWHAILLGNINYKFSYIERSIEKYRGYKSKSKRSQYRLHANLIYGVVAVACQHRDSKWRLNHAG